MQTRKYRSILAVFLTFLIILAPVSYTAKAATMEVGSTITAITDSDGLPIESSYAVTIPAGDSEPLEELLWKLLRVYATIEGKTETVTLYVDWDYNSLTANLDTPGEYTHTAPILADSYTFADGVMQSLSIVVTVTEAAEKEPDTIQSFDSLVNRYAYAVAAGSEWQEFWDSYMSGGIWQDTWICYTAEGETLYADILWENPEPDMSQTGIVTIRGTAVLPENAVLAEGVTLPVVEAPVSIQSEPTLECWCADADVIYIPWVMGELENEDTLRFLASVNGGEWKNAGEWMDTNGGSVCVWIYYLEEDSTYQVKAAWDGGETNAFEFTWNGAVTDAGPVEGDRDGGDTDGASIIDVTQPAPEETFYEEVTDTYSLLSGTRLLLMRQNGAVRFSKQDITITLSDAALDAMALTGDSRFLIGIERTEQGFVLITELDGMPLAALPDTLVLCPFTLSADGSRIFLRNVQEENVCEGNYDSEMGIVSFTIQTPGHYTIMETMGQNEPPEDTETAQLFAETEHFGTFLLIAVVSLAGLAVGGLLLWRRWRR